MKNMFGLLKGNRRMRYASVDDDELSDGDDEFCENTGYRTLLVGFLLSGICLVVGFSMGYFAQFSSIFRAQSSLAGSCTDPVTRREWRSLTHRERMEYFRAVNCLTTRPSKLGLNHTLYDEFSWVHREIGQYSHDSASFLPWHRYALHVYEKILKEECEFTGTLPYWDWSLDWQNISASSIWDPKYGFGGNGDRNGMITVGGGRCVLDGPFKDLQPVYFNHTNNPHCLSRGFNTGSFEGKIWGHELSPDSIGYLLLQPAYKNFVGWMEGSVHNVIHNGIGGDFMAFTGSNDPLFFLHHAQLDRLWWQWQRLKKARTVEYSGKHMVNSTGEASLNDVIMMAAIAEEVPVMEIMDTKGGVLCYQY